MFDYFFNPYLFFLIGCVLLYCSSEILVSNAIILSERMNISRIVIGGTIIALGTSLPEIVVSILANIKNSNNILIGNIIGSNIANIGLVFGISILYKKIHIDKSDNTYIYNILSMLAITIIFYLMLLYNELSIVNGLVFLFLYLLFFYFSINRSNATDDKKESKPIDKEFSVILKLISGCIMIYYGSNFFIDGAIGISSNLGVYDLSIGMTIVAFGTSAPELITSISALKKNEGMIVVGNIIGSNIANIIFAIGISAIIKTIYFNYNEIIIFSNIMLLMTIFFVFIIYYFKNIHKVYGILFISVYFIFIYLNFLAK